MNGICPPASTAINVSQKREFPFTEQILAPLVSTSAGQHAVPCKGAYQVTFIGKSDIVTNAVSLQQQEPVAMPKKRALIQGARSASDKMKPADDPIGTALRRLHDDVVAEPLPDEFLRLLGEIDRKITRQTGEE
jgi:hypothetical protein